LFCGIIPQWRVRHRGPDDEGSCQRERVAFGHRRLSVIDLSAAGHQPMESGDGRYGITYNGEISSDGRA
jgi:asparagine synthase (glutamine-hydrolysing)